MLDSSIKNREICHLLSQPYMDHISLMKIIRKYKKIQDENSEEKQNLKDIIFNNHVKFILKLAASKCRNTNIDIEEAFNSGVVGFLEGLEKFNPNKRYKFLTYVTFWIEKELFSVIYRNNLLYIPRNCFSQKKNGELIQFRDSKMLRLDKSNEKEDFSYRETIPDKSIPNAEDLHFENYNKELLLYIIDNFLNEKESFIVKKMYINNTDVKRNTLQTVGDLFGIKGERVRQILRISFRKIKRIYSKFYDDNKNILNQYEKL